MACYQETKAALEIYEKWNSSVWNRWVPSLNETREIQAAYAAGTIDRPRYLWLRRMLLAKYTRLQQALNILMISLIAGHLVALILAFVIFG